MMSFTGIIMKKGMSQIDLRTCLSIRAIIDVVSAERNGQAHNKSFKERKILCSSNKEGVSKGLEFMKKKIGF